MSSLTNLEKHRLEEMLGMGSGYVLNFSDRTFSRFFLDVLELDIDEKQYASGGGSKANRMRTFWRIADDASVAKVLEALVERCEYDGRGEPKQLEFAKATIARLRTNRTPSTQEPPAASKQPSAAPHQSAAAVYEVALSFAGEQRTYVAEVAKALKAAGVSVFYDEFAELWGKDLATELEKVYRSGSRYVVVFVSKDYVTKAWTTHERQHALAGRIERQDDSILPVHFDDTRLPGLPTSVVYLTIGSMSPKDLSVRILAKLRGWGA